MASRTALFSVPRQKSFAQCFSALNIYTGFGAGRFDVSSYIDVAPRGPEHIDAVILRTNRWSDRARPGEGLHIRGRRRPKAFRGFAMVETFVPRRINRLAGSLVGKGASGHVKRGANAF
jgi:hypothetical protein